MLMKAMLVDDEPLILQGLSVILDWEAEGYEIVKKATNGEEALEYLRENEVDLIITDIRMPKVDGIELLETIRREKLSNAYMVILSGYNDFKYAQAAIRCACNGYILKPVQKDQLLSNVRQAAINRAATARREVDNRKMQRGYLLQNMAELLQGKETNLSYLKENLNCNGAVRYIHICLNDMQLLEEMSDEEIALLKDKVYEGLSAFLRGGYKSNLFKDFFIYEEDHEIGYIYGEEQAKEKGLSEKEFVEGLQKAAQANCKLPVILLVGKWVEDLSKLSYSYSSASVLRSFKGFHDDKNVYYYEEELQVQETKVVLCKQPLDRLVTAVENNDTKEIDASVDALFTEMDNYGRTKEIISMNSNYLLFQLLHLATDQDESVNQDEVLSYISENVSSQENTRGSRAHIRKFAYEYAEYLIQLRKNASRGILDDIENEIREHYAENLTLRELSQKYYINSSYLGQTFRKKYGQSFKNYLNSYRVNEAAEMLLKTDKKIGQIAEEVGYHDLDYFISRFIEQWGCTPSKYRKNARE